MNTTGESETLNSFKIFLLEMPNKIANTGFELKPINNENLCEEVELLFLIICPTNQYFS
jgi:hypothetical protein